MEGFIEFISVNLVRSLQLMIKGAKGMKIEEEDDLDKELKILEQKVKGMGPKIEAVRSKKTIRELHSNSLADLFLDFVKLNSKFNKFYLENSITLWQDNSGRTLEDIDFERITNEVDNILEKVGNKLAFEYRFKNFNHFGLKTFDYTSNLEIKFNDTYYTIDFHDIEFRLDKLYNDYLTVEEISELMKKIGYEHKLYIENRIDIKNREQN